MTRIVTWHELLIEGVTADNPNQSQNTNQTQNPGDLLRMKVTAKNIQISDR